MSCIHAQLQICSQIKHASPDYPPAPITSTGPPTTATPGWKSADPCSRTSSSLHSLAPCNRLSVRCSCICAMPARVAASKPCSPSSPVALMSFRASVPSAADMNCWHQRLVAVSEREELCLVPSIVSLIISCPAAPQPRPSIMHSCRAFPDLIRGQADLPLIDILRIVAWRKNTFSKIAPDSKKADPPLASGRSSHPL